MGGGLTDVPDVGYFPGDLVVARPQGRPTSTRPVRPVANAKKYTCGTASVQPATPLITHGYNSTAGESDTGRHPHMIFVVTGLYSSYDKCVSNDVTLKGIFFLLGQWPWHAALYHSQGNVLTYICGGSLISEYYVLTAAHCVARPSTSQPINPSDLIVYLGNSRLSMWTSFNPISCVFAGKSNLKKFGSETQTMDISKIVIHREYNHTVFHNDIALLKLTRSPDITDYVRPVCLWSGSTDLNAVIDQLG